MTYNQRKNKNVTGWHDHAKGLRDWLLWQMVQATIDSREQRSATLWARYYRTQQVVRALNDEIERRACVIVPDGVYQFIPSDLSSGLWRCSASLLDRVKALRRPRRQQQ